MTLKEGKVKIEKFDGRDFSFWKMQIEDYLYQKKLYQHEARRMELARSTGSWRDQIDISQERRVQHREREDYCRLNEGIIRYVREAVSSQQSILDAPVVQPQDGRRYLCN